MRTEGFTVTVNIADLLEALQTNREEHKRKFQAAFEGYRKQVVAALEQNLEQARKGGKIVTSVHLNPPIDHTSEYDSVLGLLRMAAQAGTAQIEINQQQYAEYVRDEWGWQAHFNEVSDSYTHPL